MRVEVDRALCDGCGICVMVAPDVFEFDANDELTVIWPDHGEVTADKIEGARAAIGRCPKGALYEVPD